MRSVTALLLRAGVFFQLAIFFDLSSTISSSSRVTLLMIPLTSAFLCSVEAGDQDMSFIESTLRFLTRLSAFLISRSSSIVIPEKPVIYLIQPHMEKFILVHCTPSSSLQTSNYPNWSELPTDMIGEIVNRLPNFSTISYKLRRLLRKMRSVTALLDFLRYLCHSFGDVVHLSISVWESRYVVYLKDMFILVHRTPSSSLQTSNYPNWSKLPTDVIGEIVNPLPNFMDIKAIVAVCKQWRSACSETETTRTPPVPLLMLSETLDDSNTRQRFFNLCDSRRYQLELSRIRGKRCWGSPHGLVVTLDPDYDIHIENLDQRIEPIALPPLDTIRRELAGREEWFRLVHKFIIFKEPAESDHGLSFLVFAIFSPTNRLAFARPGRDEWTIFTNPNNLEFKDVARLQGQIWGLCDNGLLVRFEFEGTQLLEVVVIAYPPEAAKEHQKLYLVESRENLYGVFRYRKSLQVFKFNFSDSEWEEVNDLEDHALFVGDCNSWCIPTIPQIRVNDGSFVRSNSIYFTDDNWEWQMLAGVAYGGHDVGVFDMERRVIQHLPFGKDTPLYYSRPIWVTPNLIRNG
ncbi:F-box protein At2g26160-like [Fagus crenata]